MYKSFYCLTDLSQKNIFLRGCIKASSISRRRSTSNVRAPRSHSFSFHLSIGNNDIRVCRKYFRETFQVSDGRMYSCSIREDVDLVIDGRGHYTPVNKIDITDVENHIKSFPAYVYHLSLIHI